MLMKSKLTSVILTSAEGLSGFNSLGQHTLESFKTLINDLDRSAGAGDGGCATVGIGSVKPGITNNY